MSKKVLSDHKREGKRFIPPFLQLTGPWKDANWMGTIIPEFLWIALVNNFHGIKEGAHLCLSLARAATIATGISPAEFSKKFGQCPKQLFAMTTSYSSLSVEQQANLLSQLRNANQLDSIVLALRPLVSFYPECPLNFLFQGSDTTVGSEGLGQFKHVLVSLFDKYTKPATFMLATAIYIAFCTNKLKIVVGDSDQSTGPEILAKFPVIERYPDTEESRAVAAGVRAAIYSFIGSSETSSEWPNYFWNRRLELESCNYGEVIQEL
jgi:hypothetical protein